MTTDSTTDSPSRPGLPPVLTSGNHPGPGVPAPWAGVTGLHLLVNDHWRVGVLPAAGGSVAFGQIAHGGTWLDLLRPAPAEPRPDVEDCASFIMLPWSNRVGSGVLTFGGEHYRLRINADDGTAIHGTAREFPWTVRATGPLVVETAFDSRRFSGVNYPWPFSATLTYALSGSRFTITTVICNEHDAPIPVGFGHHPYFARALASAQDEAHLQLPFHAFFELDRALPSGPPVPVDGRVDFTTLRPLGQIAVDDCFTGRDGAQPIRIRYPESAREITVHADDVFTHAVLYIPPGRPYFAVEPVTNANDAFRLHADGTPDSGLRVLAPGQALTGRITLDAGPLPRG